MGLLDGLFGPRQQAAQGPGQGLLGGAWEDFTTRVGDVRQNNPEAFLALGAGLLDGDMGAAVRGMGEAMGDYRSDMRQGNLQREGWDRQDARFDKTFALQQAEHNSRLQALGTERAQEQQRLNQTLKWAESTGDPDVMGLAGAGMFNEAFKVYQSKQSGPELEFKTLPDGTYGTFNPSGGQFEPLGSAPKTSSGGVEIELPDGTRFSSGGTEGQRRNQQLYSVIQPELQTVEQTFDALGQLGNQAAGAMGTPGNFVASPEYQMGRNSLQTIISSYLYSVSGATANPGEVATQTDMLLPKPGDSAGTLDLKKKRIQTMVRAVGIAAGAAAPAGFDGGAGGGGGGVSNRTSNGLSWSAQ